MADLMPISLASPALAQEASNPSDTDADIIVTAQFCAQRLQDTPIAITAISGESLETPHLTSLNANTSTTGPALAPGSGRRVASRRAWPRTAW